MIVCVEEAYKRAPREDLKKRPIMDNSAKLVEYIRANIGLSAKEATMIIYLDKQYHLMEDEVHMGTIDEVYIYEREVIKKTLTIEAKSIMLSYNHPGGSLISDPNLLWLMKQFLKAGVVEAGHYEGTTHGAPQGGIVSPVLANIYLHYVLDLWFEKKVKQESRGNMEQVRYADDLLVCCKSEVDAKEFLESLKQRLAKFGLKISENKT